jgi:16S rRNA G966 N2-methylase RsmD
VDGSKEAIEIVRRNAERTHLLPKAQIVTGDALSYLKSCHEAPFDLCFLDPPYNAGVLPQSLFLLSSRGLIAKDGLVITESRESEDVFGGDTELADRFEIIKQNRYGIACITVMKEANI